ncbi:hypothetical protein [Baekduia sp. Peel2402]|uniref:hypothetical protein n=1 Tax=Baekduia sp. Peel2402 TaxID=3458296 RepID=UPI00403E7E45
MTDPNRPLLGEPNAPCRSCGAPLAADQRYCLQCGARRAEARLPFLEILARQVPAAAAAAPETTVTRTTSSGPASWLGRVSTNAAAVAGVACLLLALGVGVLIGGLGSDDASAGNNAAPQIITVGGSAAAPAAATTSAPASTTAPAATDTADDDTATKFSKKKASSSSKSDSKASSEVKDLDKASGDDYTKKSEKLPKTLGTGGEPPPVDKSKPIGGGSDTEEIG